MKNNYNTLEDLISDESFISWVYKTNEKDLVDWNLWLSNNPEKVQMANEAASVLLLMRIKEVPVNDEQLAAAAARLRTAMQPGYRSAKVISIKRKRVWYAAAAAILIISITAGFGLLFHSSNTSQLATNYGQVKKNKLPDGTEVILNAHSTLTYGKEWKEGMSREVWIEGEAFFHVKKTPKHDKFIVHTDAFDIEVTGTSFNVTNLDGKSSIILKEGSVKIHRKGEAEIVMKPGDFVEFNNRHIQKKTIAKQDYMAWIDNKLVFDNTPLTNVVNIIKEHYGVEVKLQGNNITAQTITGIMPNDNLEVLLQALDATQEFKIIHSNDTITITSEIQ